jgi:hypothetical protein
VSEARVAGSCEAIGRKLPFVVTAVPLGDEMGKAVPDKVRLPPVSLINGVVVVLAKLAPLALPMAMGVVMLRTLSVAFKSGPAKFTAE